MPYYKITLWLKNGTICNGIKQIDSWNIDAVFILIKNKATAHYRNGELKEMDVQMLSKHSWQVKKILSKLG